MVLILEVSYFRGGLFPGVGWGVSYSGVILFPGWSLHAFAGVVLFWGGISVEGLL